MIWSHGPSHVVTNVPFKVGLGFPPPAPVRFIAEKGVCLRIRRLVFSRPNTLPWCCKSLSTSCKTLHGARFVRGRLFKRESKEGWKERERERERKSWGGAGGERKEGRRERRKGERGCRRRGAGAGARHPAGGAGGSVPGSAAQRGTARLGGGREGGSGGGAERSQTSSSHRVDVERGP